jgi:uridine kinase
LSNVSSMNKPVLIGVAGGTGSGKTTFATAITASVGTEKTLVISQDAYYRDRAQLSLEERARINYDHPCAFDSELLRHHLTELKAGRPVPRLDYDYITHTRKETGLFLEPKQVVILEGIMVLENKKVRSVLDIKIYIDADSDVRLIRRLHRDISERGRTLESVTRQYLESVRPMHLEFVEPSKRYADVIVQEGAQNQVALDLVIARIRSLLDAA